MKNNYIFFHPYYLIKTRHEVVFYRSHLDFLLNLLKCIIKNKTFFLMHRSIFFNFIIHYFSEYNSTQYYKKESYSFFLKIILNIKNIQKQKNYNLYSYIISLIGIMLYLGYYNIGIVSIAKYSKNNDREISELIMNLLEKYKLNSKTIFITVNQQLEKGIIFYHRDLVIDLSLKKLYELLNNKISINLIGELWI